MNRKLGWTLAGASLPGIWMLSAAAAQSGGAKTTLPSDPRMAQIVKSVDPARIHDEDTKLVSFGSRLATAEDKSTATRGPVPARAWIQQQFQAISDANGGRLQVKIDTFDLPAGPRIPAGQTMSNVVATLPGADPNDKRIFLVGGHYDSIPADFTQDAPGANDDASGTIVSLECARALAKFQFPATIEFYAYEGEEEGTYGSKHAADAAKAAGLDIAGVLNDDIVGGDKTPGNDNTDRIRAFGQGLSPLLSPQENKQQSADGFENDSPSRELIRYVQMVANRYVPNFHVVLEYRVDRFRRGSDHEPWLEDGFSNAMTFREWMENSNHQHVAVRTGPDGTEYGDLEEWVNFDYIAQVARVNAVTLASLASSPATPERATFQAGQQMGDRIQWTPVEGAANYMLLYRGTADPSWSERPIDGKPAAPPAARGGEPAPAPAPAVPAAPMLEATIPESGDTYILAIAAVDAQGHESLPRVAMAPMGGGRGGAGRGRGAAPAAAGGGGAAGGGAARSGGGID